MADLHLLVLDVVVERPARDRKVVPHVIHKRVSALSSYHIINK